MKGLELEGALVTLKRVSENDAKKLHEHLQNPDLYLEAGLYNPPSLEVVESDLRDEELCVWEVLPENRTQPVGYAGFVTYSGPTYVFVHFHDWQNIDLDMAQDAMLLLVHGYFQNTDFERLWTYTDKPVPDEIHDRLLEGGFDPVDEELPGIENDKTAAYVMERHTYDAYYGDGVEDVDDI